MRLFFAISSMDSGGAEKVMSLLCNEFVKRGHEVYLITVKPGNSFYELDQGVKFCHFFSEDDEKRNLYVKKFVLFRRIIKAVKKIKPDIIISFMYNLSAWMILSKLFHNVPVIASEHTTFDLNESFWVKFKRLYLCKYADAVVVLTKYDYDFIGNKIKNKFVIYNPIKQIDLSFNKNRKKNILAVGSIERWHGKGFDNLLKIFSQVSKKYPDWNLIIAGKTNKDSLKFLNSTIKNYELTDKVIFTGEIKNIYDTMRECSIFAFTSRYEGFGLVLAEAMMNGCACISFDCVAGPNEIIKNDEDGILIENQNIEEFIIGLSKLIESEKLRDRLGKNAEENVKRFSVEKIADEWEKLFYFK